MFDDCDDQSQPAVGLEILIGAFTAIMGIGLVALCSYWWLY